jgi:endonuclease-3
MAEICTYDRLALRGRRADTARYLHERITRVCRTLSCQYPSTRLGNKRNPLDEYLYITLSLRTHAKGFGSAYRDFKHRFPCWKVAYHASEDELASAIVVGGLARQKAANIKRTLALVQETFGSVSLRRLREMTRREVEHFLLQLPGIGLKSARCIMMYSLGFRVLPVDTHVARIAYRLGWTDTKDSETLHRELEKMVPPKWRFSFHVCCVQHGRAVCRGQYPRCEVCCLAGICQKKGVPTKS